MHTARLLSATMLAGAVLLHEPAFAADSGTITANTVTAAEKPVTVAEVSDPRAAAERFIAHINYARVAIAMNNMELASEHIANAQGMLSILKAASTEQRRAVRVESGQVIYDYQTTYKYHYFPVEMGPVEIKKLKTGPFWAKKGLAVSDAEIVYLTLDLTGDAGDTRLAEAASAIKNGKSADAQKALVKLTDEVIKVEEKQAIPLDKARDNIALAYSFVSQKNYDGARYALNHADDALDKMERDKAFTDRRASITTMRREVRALQDVIKSNDPTLMDKAGDKLEAWWNDLTGWTAK